jgi:hypothetical protein
MKGINLRLRPTALTPSMLRFTARFDHGYHHPTLA